MLRRRRRHQKSVAIHFSSGALLLGIDYDFLDEAVVLEGAGRLPTKCRPHAVDALRHDAAHFAPPNIVGRQPGKLFTRGRLALEAPAPNSRSRSVGGKSLRRRATSSIIRHSASVPWSNNSGQAGQRKFHGAARQRGRRNFACSNRL